MQQSHGFFAIAKLLLVKSLTNLICTVVMLAALHAEACEGDVLTAQCHDGDVIKVISANYGRRDESICPHNWYDDSDVQCIHSDALQIVVNRSVCF